MADILAISAAVVQFLDVAVRVSLGLGKLYSDIRDVPGQLHRLKLDIDQQIAIAKYILSSHATFQSDPPTAFTATSPIDQTLADYVLAMEELTVLLQSIRSEDDAGSIRRSWNAIRAVHKRNSILLLCDRLEHQKSTILLWLASANTTAPAFCAIRKTWQSHFSETGIQPAHVSALERTLRDIFECQQASVFDEDAKGNTLLYEVLRLYISNTSRSTPPIIEFLSLIRFLIDGGANPNINRRVEYKNGIVITQGGTVLDIFASRLLSLDRNWIKAWSTDKSVYESLIDGGAIFSRPLATCVTRHPSFYFGHFEQEVVELQTFEEQVDVCDLNDLMVSIIRRNEPDFIRALGKDDIHAVSRANGLRAIHLATYWPWALRQIIQTGADVNCEDNDHRRPIHLAVACQQAQAVEILLQADCSVSTPEYSNSLLQEALIQGRVFDHVTDLIIDALIDRHTRLRDLALSVLPNNSGSSVDTEKETLSEIRAPEIYDSLIRAKQNVPPALQVDRDEEGVYDTADMHGNIRLTVTLADKLWRGGFHRVDEFAPLNGLTPLLQSWYIADFDMVSWFIEKGASPFTTHRDVHNTGSS
ncbi:hypothetical protein CNMCM6936_005687 [Aspergillus lentulus]|nr:hypothetical protein CNMCM6936_005687 [Aspergillus lentulus]KAF4176351.1 hypothetical protein CNMCM7927_004193 [Aspergillus lentulus]